MELLANWAEFVQPASASWNTSSVKNVQSLCRGPFLWNANVGRYLDIIFFFPLVLGRGIKNQSTQFPSAELDEPSQNVQILVTGA